MKILLALIGIVVLVIFLGLLFSLPVMWLWNGCLVDAVQGVKEVTWLQAWGLNVLFGILFKTTINKD
ncbi:hypothetical protein UFOVP71_333 [uncultured Caudovirales phage]|jgi:hypothetical protein|uniref:Uncharacterized protein n=1 Tax=uncultured Caudovirales phage TaxID=2100421 RepID=A0A6J5TA36_9CAUD|nr:hypothetical protein UFOVP71_333 [uncultured Caudovirales phage]